MSRFRGLFPVVLAVGFGVLNGYVTFAPSFQSLEADKQHGKTQSESTPSSSPAKPDANNTTAATNASKA
ncbi:hypothetical protein AJ79_04057 [Helicocarpus griseus UAMH5409]|uniref:Uncharacterized protein n=1 Tax=Helicocarpus griseus UAMH5409 TaxID=1447875 RepID=A0A2B7XVL4_9EURO|nr:hypothetical protein AJ79_04057 [Helicocarpus griseus UAMH5409]